MDNIKNFFSGINKRTWIIVGVAAAIVVASFAGMLITRNMKISKTDIVKGVDVSAYQGSIDWKTIENQDIYFAFIKASEGTDYKDSQFDTNWKNIDGTSIKKGAYMFYVFNEDGQAQADYFIKTVGTDYGDLPPVIDLEVYGQFETSPPTVKSVQNNLKKLIEKLKSTYKVEPIIYTNYNTYNLYLSDGNLDQPIWITDLSDQVPEMSGGHDWKFWQYSQRGILNGYSSDSERFIDMDLYNGTLAEFYKEYK